MSVVKVKSKITGEMLDARVDFESLQQVSAYAYTIDKFSKKPFRDVKEGTNIRRYFLDRDILGCTMNDGKIVYHKNDNPLDNRLDNLFVKQRVIRKSNTGHHWPQSPDSLLNFLEKRKGPDEDICVDFLARADVTKFTKKQIDVVAPAEDYDTYKKKHIDYAIKRVLHRYFEWSGTLNLVKEVAIPSFLSVAIPLVPAAPAPVAPVAPPVAPPIPVTPVVVAPVKESQPRITYPFDVPASTSTADKQIKGELYRMSSDKILDLLRDYRIFPTEFLIKILQERGANTVQFNRSR